MVGFAARGSWQCLGCGTVYAYWVSRCLNEHPVPRAEGFAGVPYDQQPVTVTLAAPAVAGLLITTRGIIEAAEAQGGMERLAAEVRSVRLALTAALRAHGWTPSAENPEKWEMRPGGDLP